MDKKYDSIIIGSGAGGLASALCLARAGQNILLLEQHDVPGGWCHSFTLNGQRFSPGVHYVGSVGEGEGTNELLRGLGVANDLVFFEMNTKGYEHCHIGDEKFSMPAGIENLKTELCKRFPEEKKAIIKYLDLVKSINTQLMLMPKMNGFWDLLTIPFKMKNVGKYGLFTLKRVIDWHIKDPLLKTILNIQCGDHGLAPYKASFMVHSVLMAHYFDGGFYPMGGGGGYVKAFTKRIKALGGEIRTQAKVDKIIVEQGKAIGVKLENGEIIKADCIISNADPSITYLNLIGEENISKKLKKRLDNTKYSVSSLIMFLTLDMDVTKYGIDSGNIWKISEPDLDIALGNLTKETILEGDEFKGVFLSCTTLKDPASFNGRYHNFEIVTFIDYSTFEQFEELKDYHTEEYETFKNKLIDKILNTVESIIPNARKHVIQAELGTPMTNNFYINSTRGNVYGTEKTLKGVGPFAFKPKTEIENLYLTGASTLSHGVGGATNSGLATAARILGCKAEDLLIEDENQLLRIIDPEDSTSWPDWLNQKRADKSRRFSEVDLKEIDKE
ncbi:MAG: NAD(P)/FAD-dependent oxidoreductase [Crocinitomicaceae bacterium]